MSAFCFMQLAEQTSISLQGNIEHHVRGQAMCLSCTIALHSLHVVLQTVQDSTAWRSLKRRYHAMHISHVDCRLKQHTYIHSKGCYQLPVIQVQSATDMMYVHLVLDDASDTTHKLQARLNPIFMSGCKCPIDKRPFTPHQAHTCMLIFCKCYHAHKVPMLFSCKYLAVSSDLRGVHTSCRTADTTCAGISRLDPPALGRAGL